MDEPMIGDKMQEVGLWIKELDGLVWGPWLLVLLFGTGIYFMVRMRFLPLRNLKKAFGYAFEKREEAGEGDGISPFAALMTELAATIGTGNIVGVASAMVLGGPGALFWMIVAALVGMAVKLAENMLAVKYRSYAADGEPVGGPMYVLYNRFPMKRVGKLLAYSFAFFAVLASWGMGNMTQSNSIADALQASFQVPVAKSGLFISIITILVVLGGIKSIARVTGVVVPFMGILYMAGIVGVLLKHWNHVLPGIGQIIVTAFYPEAVGGGAVGCAAISVMQSVRWGVSRGVFSNEAGLGASGISAAASGTKDYVKQGYLSMIGVFLDTIVICSMTGLAMLAAGAFSLRDGNGEALSGTEMTIAVFESAFGKAGGYFVSICIVLFAFATIVGWAYQGEKAFEFMVKKKAYCIYYRFFYGLIAFVGAVCSLEIVWDFSDICNGLMAVPNLIGILVLSGEACREIIQYEK